MSDFLVVQHLEDVRAWRITGVGAAIPDDFRLIEGVRLRPDYPERVVLDLHPSSGAMQVDFLRNTDEMIVASPRAVEVLKAGGVQEKDVELLPVSIRDRKGRIAPEPYAIVNPVVKVACMDRDRSEFELYKGSDEVLGIGSLHIRPDLVPSDLPLFRLGDSPNRILVREDLMKAIADGGLTGFRAVPMGTPLI